MHNCYLKVAKTALEHLDVTPLAGKNVLITGSNGLLGSHMVATIAYANQIQNLGTRVSCISRSKPEPWIQEILDAASFEFIPADLSLGLPHLRGRYFDYVIHAATYGQPKKFLERPLETMTLNSTITEQLLKLTALAKGTFLFMSSSEIYGNPPKDVMPVHESYHGTSSPIDQRSAYTSSKRFGETLCKVYQDQNLVTARIARVSSVYGPGAQLIDDRVLNVFIQRALTTGNLRLMDMGTQSRRWLYIADALVMLFHILLHGKELVYNVSGNDLKSIGDLANFVGELTNVPVEFPGTVETLAHTLGAPLVIDLDNSRILLEAKLKNLLTLKEGLKECVTWTRDLLDRTSKETPKWN